MQVVIGSNAIENEPRLSPDGRRLAFESKRSGFTGEIWVADADGSNPQSLTHGMAGFQGSPYWSPDGRRIVFDSLDDDLHYHIWIIDADGGSPRRLTTQADNEHAPTWSRDGRWIYFSSVQGGAARDIWRVSVGRSDVRATDPRGERAIRVRDDRWQDSVIPAEGCGLAADGDAAPRRCSAAARGMCQEDAPLAPVRRACITCRAIRARIHPSMSWI